MPPVGIFFSVFDHFFKQNIKGSAQPVFNFSRIQPSLLITDFWFLQSGSETAFVFRFFHHGYLANGREPQKAVFRSFASSVLFRFVPALVILNSPLVSHEPLGNLYSAKG